MLNKLIDHKLKQNSAISLLVVLMVHDVSDRFHLKFIRKRKSLNVYGIVRILYSNT